MPAIPEAEFQKCIEQLCDERKILYHHCKAMYQCSGSNGMPDLVLIGRYVLWVELKSSWGQLKPHQNAYRIALERAGAKWAMWRPRDLYNGVVDAALDDLEP